MVCIAQESRRESRKTWFGRWPLSTMPSAAAQGSSRGMFSSARSGICSSTTGLNFPQRTATRSFRAARARRFSTPRAGTARLGITTASRGRPPRTPPDALTSAMASSTPRCTAVAEVLVWCPNSRSRPTYTGSAAAASAAPRKTMAECRCGSFSRPGYGRRVPLPLGKNPSASGHETPRVGRGVRSGPTGPGRGVRRTRRGTLDYRSKERIAVSDSSKTPSTDPAATMRTRSDGIRVSSCR